MNFCDPPIVSVSAINNVIDDIHAIKADIHRLNNYTCEITSSPLLSRVEVCVNRRSLSPKRAALRSHSIDTFMACQDNVSAKINDLHTQADIALIRSRSGSPVRPALVPVIRPAEIVETTVSVVPRPVQIVEAVTTLRPVTRVTTTTYTRPTSLPRHISYTSKCEVPNLDYTRYIRTETGCKCHGEGRSARSLLRPSASCACKSSLNRSRDITRPYDPSRSIVMETAIQNIDRARSIQKEIELEKRASRLNTSISTEYSVRNTAWQPHFSPIKSGLYNKDSIMEKVAAKQKLEAREMDIKLGRNSFGTPSLETSLNHRPPHYRPYKY